MGRKMVNEVFFSSVVPGPAKLFYVWLAFRGNKGQWLQWPIDKMVEELGASSRTIRGWVTELEQVGAIEHRWPKPGVLRIDLRPFVLDQVLGGVVDVVSHKAGAQGLELICDVAPDVPPNLVGRLEAIWRMPGWHSPSGWRPASTLASCSIFCASAVSISPSRAGSSSCSSCCWRSRHWPYACGSAWAAKRIGWKRRAGRASCICPRWSRAGRRCISPCCSCWDSARATFTSAARIDFFDGKMV